MRYADEGVFLRCFLSGYLIEGFIDLLVAFVFYFCLTLSFRVCLQDVFGEIIEKYFLNGGKINFL